MERTFAFARTLGGMTLSGAKDCRGSTNDAKILLHFLHSAAVCGQLLGVERVSWGGDVHAIDDGRKLCIPTGIVKLLSYFARDG